MRLLITGADGPLGRLAAAHLGGRHDLLLCGAAGKLDGVGHRYRQVDLRSAEDVRQLVVGREAILHFSEFVPALRTGHLAEQDTLDHAAVGTYRLCGAAREAGVGRMILASTLAFFDAYPKDFMVDELWRPWPATEPEQLAPFMAEIVVREFCREGGINAVCLRFLPIGDDRETNTSAADALQAIDKALAVQFKTPGYRWQLYHIAAADRFITRNARLGLGYGSRQGA